MKESSIEELNIMLCSTGYLPPRTEDELLFFNEMYEDYKPHIADRHVDIESILNGTCRVISTSYCEIEMSDREHNMVAENKSNDYSMAARNFNKLPKALLDKMRKQHTAKNEDEK